MSSSTIHKVEPLENFPLLYVQIQVQTSTGETFARNTEALFMETSAKDGRNVQELFRTIGIYMYTSEDSCILAATTVYNGQGIKTKLFVGWGDNNYYL